MKYTPFVIAMGITICISNILVQKLLGNYLTFAAFTYPVAFLITDLANRIHGKAHAKKVLLWGFAFGVFCSFIAWGADKTTVRIAVGSGLAFFLAQFVDIHLFDRLRGLSWWKTPAISSVVGSAIDTAIFFSVAFSAVTFKWVEGTIFADQNSWSYDVVPLLSVGPQLPLWVSLAVADFCIKILMVIVLLLPYKLVMTHATQKIVT